MDDTDFEAQATWAGAGGHVVIGEAQARGLALGLARMLSVGPRTDTDPAFLEPDQIGHLGQ